MRLLIILFCSNFIFSDSYFPNETWEKKSASELGLNEEKVKSVLDFLEKLEDDDDVQHVYANLKIDNNFMDKHST